MEDNNAARLVSSAILGLDGETVIIADKAYFIKPPTIRKIAGAANALSGFGGKDVSETLGLMKDIGKACEALSWFITGDDSLSVELSQGTLDEVVRGLETAVGLLSIRDFQMLSTLSRSVQRLAANPRP